MTQMITFEELNEISDLSVDRIGSMSTIDKIALRERLEGYIPKLEAAFVAARATSTKKIKLEGDPNPVLVVTIYEAFQLANELIGRLSDQRAPKRQKVTPTPTPSLEPGSQQFSEDTNMRQNTPPPTLHQDLPPFIIPLQGDSPNLQQIKNKLIEKVKLERQIDPEAPDKTEAIKLKITELQTILKKEIFDEYIRVRADKEEGWEKERMELIKRKEELNKDFSHTKKITELRSKLSNEIDKESKPSNDASDASVSAYNNTIRKIKERYRRAFDEVEKGVVERDQPIRKREEDIEKEKSSLTLPYIHLLYVLFREGNVFKEEDIRSIQSFEDDEEISKDEVFGEDKGAKEVRGEGGIIARFLRRNNDPWNVRGIIKKKPFLTGERQLIAKIERLENRAGDKKETGRLKIERQRMHIKDAELRSLRLNEFVKETDKEVDLLREGANTGMSVTSDSYEPRLAFLQKLHFLRKACTIVLTEADGMFSDPSIEAQRKALLVLFQQPPGEKKELEKLERHDIIYSFETKTKPLLLSRINEKEEKKKTNDLELTVLREELQNTGLSKNDRNSKEARMTKLEFQQESLTDQIKQAFDAFQQKTNSLTDKQSILESKPHTTFELTTEVGAFQAAWDALCSFDALNQLLESEITQGNIDLETIAESEKIELREMKALAEDSVTLNAQELARWDVKLLEAYVTSDDPDIDNNDDDEEGGRAVNFGVLGDGESFTAERALFRNLSMVEQKLRISPPFLGSFVEICSGIKRIAETSRNRHPIEYTYSVLENAKQNKTDKYKFNDFVSLVGSLFVARSLATSKEMDALLCAIYITNKDAFDGISPRDFEVIPNVYNAFIGTMNNMRGDFVKDDQDKLRKDIKEAMDKSLGYTLKQFIGLKSHIMSCLSQLESTSGNLEGFKTHFRALLSAYRRLLEIRKENTRDRHLQSIREMFTKKVVHAIEKDIDRTTEWPSKVVRQNTATYIKTFVTIFETLKTDLEAIREEYDSILEQSTNPMDFLQAYIRTQTETFGSVEGPVYLGTDLFGLLTDDSVLFQKLNEDVFSVIVTEIQEREMALSNKFKKWTELMTKEDGTHLITLRHRLDDPTARVNFRLAFKRSPEHFLIGDINENLIEWMNENRRVDKLIDNTLHESLKNIKDVLRGILTRQGTTNAMFLNRLEHADDTRSKFSWMIQAWTDRYQELEFMGKQADTNIQSALKFLKSAYSFYTAIQTGDFFKETGINNTKFRTKCNALTKLFFNHYIYHRCSELENNILMPMQLEDLSIRKLQRRYKWFEEEMGQFKQKLDEFPSSSSPTTQLIQLRKAMGDWTSKTLIKLYVELFTSQDVLIKDIGRFATYGMDIHKHGYFDLVKVCIQKNEQILRNSKDKPLPRDHKALEYLRMIWERIVDNFPDVNNITLAQPMELEEDVSMPNVVQQEGEDESIAADEEDEDMEEEGNEEEYSVVLDTTTSEEEE